MSFDYTKYNYIDEETQTYTNMKQVVYKDVDRTKSEPIVWWGQLLSYECPAGKWAIISCMVVYSGIETTDYKIKLFEGESIIKSSWLSIISAKLADTDFMIQAEIHEYDIE